MCKEGIHFLIISAMHELSHVLNCRWPAMDVPSMDQGWGRAMQTNMCNMTTGISTTIRASSIYELWYGNAHAICRDDMTTPTAQLSKCMLPSS